MCRIGLRTLKQIVVYSSFCCIFRHVLWKEWLLQQYHQHNREHKKWASTRIDAIVAVVAHTSRKCKQNKSNPFWEGGSSKQSLCFGMVVYDGWFPDRTSPRFASIPKWNNKKNTPARVMHSFEVESSFSSLMLLLKATVFWSGFYFCQKGRTMEGAVSLRSVLNRYKNTRR